MRALASEPSDRFESVLALRRAIADELELTTQLERRRARAAACLERARTHRERLATIDDRRTLRPAIFQALAELAGACAIDPDGSDGRAELAEAMREAAAHARRCGDPELAEDLEALDVTRIGRDA